MAKEGREREKVTPRDSQDVARIFLGVKCLRQKIMAVNVVGVNN